MSRHLKLVAFTLSLLKQAAAHTWIEQLTNVAPNGSYVAGYGYARSFTDRLPNFDQEANKWLLPQTDRFVKATDLLCHPSQRSAVQSPNYPRLQSSPGNMVAMRYLENGHVTIPGGGTNLPGKPALGGTVFVFGTQDPRQGETLLDVLAWTRDGLGGDRRGRLLTAQDFDDGRCYQNRPDRPLAAARLDQFPNPVPGQLGAHHELSCETDVQMPSDVDVGKPYTLYWIWQWPTMRSSDLAKDEYYTSCVDIDVVVEVSSKDGENPSNFGDPMRSAVPGFQSRGALTQDPLALSSNPNFQPSVFGQASATMSSQATSHPWVVD
jgi:hypothetical protein